MAEHLCGRKLGDFELLGKLGQGGGGTLYRCSQPLLQREAVVKVLRDGGNKEAEDRFLREARLASRLDHHYAAHVYAFGVEHEDGLRWIAMELVAGVTLDEWLCKHGPMSLEQFVPLFECIAEVVQAAHDYGIVHRDLKPANVMVIERGGRLIPKLLDFGIAKMSEDGGTTMPELWPDDPSSESHDPSGAAAGEVTSTDPKAKDCFTPSRAAIGSLEYMSPEQWDDSRSVRPASDIYALGVLAYKALTGRVPFSAHTRTECRRQHLYAKVPPLGPGFPAALDRIFERALAKVPEDRHSTAVELASELRAVLMASERELLRSLARQWDACARPPGLLLNGDVLAGVERWTRRVPSDALSKLECSYVAASQRSARRSALIRRLLAAAAVAVTLGGIAFTSVQRARMAEDHATQTEIERGQQALLHGEMSEAMSHLWQAYERGERSPGIKFMLARALQPLMSERARLTSSSGRMWSVLFAADGKRVLTSDDKAARMWDASSSQLLFTMSHGDMVSAAVFSSDERKIITAGADGTVRIWSAAAGAPIRELRYQGTSQSRWRYAALAVSSHLIAAIDATGTAVHVWDAEAGAQIAELTNDGPGIALLAFSTDGRWLATSGRDEVRVFDTSLWRQALAIPGPRVRSLRFDPTSPRLAVGTYDGMASIWEIPTGARVRSLREPGGASVDVIAFSGDGTLVATASRDGTVQVWGARSGGLRRQFRSHRDKIYAVEFSSTGDTMLSAGADGAVVLSNLTTGIAVARFEGFKNVVIAAHFDSQSRRVVGASWDGTARVWGCCFTISPLGIAVGRP